MPRYAAHHCPVNRPLSQSMDVNTFLSLLMAADQSGSSQAPLHTPAVASHHTGRPYQRPFTPTFDMIETQQAYILEGELPGLSDKKAVDIEFTDHQTLLVKGKVEKHITSSSVPAPSGTTQTTATEEEHTSRPRSPPRPTVEDDITEDDDGRSSILTPASTVVGHEEVKREVGKQQQQQQKDQLKYWVLERTIGTFQRTFNFPGLIDQDKVTAKLENGILTIVVPKRSKANVRKVEIM